MKIKNLSKKFSRNSYFEKVELVSKDTCELSGIKPALEKLSKRNDVRQFEVEERLKKRIIKFLGFEPAFSINY